MSNARQLCEKIERYRKTLVPLVPSIVASSKSPDEVITKLLEALQFTPAEVDAFRTKVKSRDTKSCIIGSDTVQSNTFDTTECAEILGCKNRRDPVYREQLTRELGAEQANRQMELLNTLCRFEGDQSNVSQVSQGCAFSDTLDLLQKQPFDPLIKSITDALVNASPTDCSKVPDSYSNTKYAKAVQICSAYAGLDQVNVARCASKVRQSNTAAVFQDCVLNNMQKDTEARPTYEIQSPDTTETSKTQTVSEAVTKTTGLSLNMALAIGAVLVAITTAVVIYRKRA